VFVLSNGRCCVLGTLGSFWVADCWSFGFRPRFSPDDFADWLDDAEDDDDDAGTDWPAGMSLGPLSGLDGLDDEHLLWWRREAHERA